MICEIAQIPDLTWAKGADCIACCHVCSRYQLVWMTDAEVASNIVMMSVTSPFLFVVDPQTHEYYLPDDTTLQQISVDAVVDFFNDISNGSRQVSQSAFIRLLFVQIKYGLIDSMCHCSQGDVDYCLLSPQPDSSLHWKTIDTGLVHHIICLFMTHLSYELWLTDIKWRKSTGTCYCLIVENTCMYLLIFLTALISLMAINFLAY